MMTKFDGVTSDGEPTPNPLDTAVYKDLTYKQLYYCVDEKTGQVDLVTVGGTKHDSGKPDLSLVPSSLVKEAAKAYMYGEEKYGRYNFEKGFESHRLLGACLRHVFAWIDGEDNDQESGVSHLGHAAATLGMVLRCLELGTLTDTRSKQSKRQS